MGKNGGVFTQPLQLLQQPVLVLLAAVPATLDGLVKRLTGPVTPLQDHHLHTHVRAHTSHT